MKALYIYLDETFIGTVTTDTVRGHETWMFRYDDAYVNAARPFLDPAIANVKDPQFPLSLCFGLRPCGASPFGRAKAADMGAWSVEGLITMVE